MHYFSNLFYKVRYMFRTCPLSIIRSISTLYTQQQVFVMLALASRHQQNQHDKYILRVLSVEIFLMMESGTVRNMQNILSNKFEKQYISLAFIIRIYHDARPSECQILPIIICLSLTFNEEILHVFSMYEMKSNVCVHHHHHHHAPEGLGVFPVP